MDANKERLKGAAEELKGDIKSAVGKLTGNEKLEAEGAIDREEGKLRQEAAKTIETVRGIGEEIKGNIKSAVGDLTDNPKLQVEGKLDQLAGQARKKANE